MPMLIDYIDKIARDKKRDVLYLEFCKKPDFNRADFDEYYDIVVPIQRRTHLFNNHLFLNK